MDKNIECCPKFDPEPWDNKYFDWEGKLFVKAKVKTLFYMPLNFGNVIKKTMDIISKSNGEVKDWLCLSDHTSKWNMDIYLAVNKSIPNIENVKISGKIYSKVYEGNFNETGNWCKDYDKRLEENNLKRKKMYMWYTTCPKCAKKYGKNYVVILSEI